MGKIYEGQTQLRIIADTSVDITGALSLKIKYIKPSETAGEFVATELVALDGTFYYDIILDTELDEIGLWIFWGWVNFSDGREAPGEPISVRVWERGK